MASFGSHVLQKGYMLLLLLAFSTWISAIDVDVCSSFNTGETPLNVSIWQTNGLCTGFCSQKNYAFAITQKNSCWCSNYYPDKTTDSEVSKCDLPCPAWTSEFCGGPGLFGYILLNEVAPSGTKTPSATSSTATQSTASTSASTGSSSKTTSTSASASSSSSSTSETSTTSSSSSSSTSSSTSTDPASSTPGQTDGSDNSASRTGDPSPDQNGSSGKKSGLGTGAIVGIVVGIVGGLLVLGAAILFWFIRRRRLNKDEYRDDPSVRGSSSGMVGSVPPRNECKQRFAGFASFGGQPK
ncbi:hypothetical protein TrVGV298_010703 [Trichoderma virens]|nr:hypothetical protein TrVGV298_010703 [Trichoderma virens]